MYCPTSVQASLTRLMRISRSGESGQGMVEYAFILVLIALVVIVTLILVGNHVFNMWSDISVGIKLAAP